MDHTYSSSYQVAPDRETAGSESRDPRHHLRHRDRLKHKGPAMVALAVAVFSVTAMLLVDHGPWNKPQVQTAEVHNYSTTGEAAHAVGATVTKTAPKASIEPEPPGPKPVHPANPEPPGSAP